MAVLPVRFFVARTGFLLAAVVVLVLSLVCPTHAQAASESSSHDRTAVAAVQHADDTEHDRAAAQAAHRTAADSGGDTPGWNAVDAGHEHPCGVGPSVVGTAQASVPLSGHADLACSVAVGDLEAPSAERTPVAAVRSRPHATVSILTRDCVSRR
ncbi:MAG: hypothetical protein ACT4QF_02805 [Sporichthyaceae bacterium]